MKRQPRTTRARKGKATTALAKRPSPPHVRGVRGHRAIDQQAGLRELVDGWLLETPRPTYDEILERLKGTGYYISRSSLARYGLEFLVRQREVALLAEKAKALSADAPDSVLEMERAIAALANARIFDYLIDGKTPIDEATQNIIAVAAKLQSSSSSRERARLAHNRAVQSAAAAIKTQLQAQLKKNPELLRQILRMVDDVASEVQQ